MCVEGDLGSKEEQNSSSLLSSMSVAAFVFLKEI